MDPHLKVVTRKKMVNITVAVTEDMRLLLQKSAEELPDKSMSRLVREALGEFFEIREELRHGPGKAEGGRRGKPPKSDRPRGTRRRRRARPVSSS